MRNGYVRRHAPVKAQNVYEHRMNNKYCVRALSLE
jgi:hypothetical protein